MHVPILLLSTLLANHAATFDSSTQIKIDNVVQTGIQCRGNPGLALSIVKNGQVLLSKGYGVTDLDSQQPVTADTRFQIASLTKAFTSALLTTILEENHMSVSTNVRKVSGLPDDFAFNNTLRTAYATLEDLLSHRTGIPRNNYLRLSADHSRQTLPPKLKYLPSVGGFRDSFYYNDLLYSLAAYSTQLIGNRPWEDLIRDKIFTPLGMRRSTFIGDVDFSGDDVATPYVLENNKLLKASLDFVKHWGSNVGSGNIFSTANDMANWMRMLLNGGLDTAGSRVLQQSVLDTVFKPCNTIPPASYAADYMRPTLPETFSADTYGLGWRLGYYKGYRMAYHSGSTWGYRSFLTLLPDLNIGVFSVMTGVDEDYPFRTSLHMYLMDQALGDSPFIDNTTICTFPEPWKSRAGSGRRRRAAPDRDTLLKKDEANGGEVRAISGSVSRQARAATSIPLANHAGVFRHQAYGDLTVRVNSSCSCLELEYGIGHWQLQPKQEPSYTGRWTKDPPKFSMDFVFLARGQDVFGVQAPDFENSEVPVFYRQAGPAPIG